jgi:hypothetical protein
VKKEYLVKLYTLFGLVTLAVVILVMSVFSKNISDTRILGVHTIPTIVPTSVPTKAPTSIPTKIPTVEPTPFLGCVGNGRAVSNPTKCCSGTAVYVWSSYICGDAKSSVMATVTPKKILITPTINFGRPTLLVPTIKKTDCQASTLDVECVDSNGRNCKWYRNVDCSWTCNQNCKDKEVSSKQETARSYVVQNSISNVFKLVKIGSCSTGKDYNKDGTINSLDIVFCKNNSSQFSKNINSFVGQINEEAPKWVDWIVTKMVGN